MAYNEKHIFFRTKYHVPSVPMGMSDGGKYMYDYYSLCAIHKKKKFKFKPQKKADVHLKESRLLGAIANYDEENKKTSFEYIKRG